MCGMWVDFPGAFGPLIGMAVGYAVKEGLVLIEIYVGGLGYRKC